MFDQLRILDRKRRRTFLAALTALIAAMTGCDRKPQWRGVGTDSRDNSQAGNNDAAPGEPAHGPTR